MSWVTSKRNVATGVHSSKEIKYGLWMVVVRRSMSRNQNFGLGSASQAGRALVRGARAGMLGNVAEF